MPQSSRRTASRSEYNRRSSRSPYDGNAARRINAEPQRVERPDRKERKRSNIVHFTDRELRKARRAAIKPIKALSTVAMAAVAFVLVFALIYGKVELTELTSQVSDAQTELTELQSVQVQLEMTQAADSTGTELENYAKNVLGMSEVRSDQVVYVNLNGGDTGVIEDGNSDVGIFKKIWNTVSSWFE